MEPALGTPHLRAKPSSGNIGGVGIPPDSQPDPQPAQTFRIGRVRQQRQRPVSAVFQAEVQNDDAGVGVAAAQAGATDGPSASFQAPAPVHEFDARDKVAAATPSVAKSRPRERRADSRAQSQLDPGRHVGQEDRDAGRHMGDPERTHQQPRGS